jgi:glutamate--cysteine ligase
MTDSKPLQVIAALDRAALSFQRGIEREGLRVDSNGTLSAKQHPEVFGSKLSHPMITTDFSESQLELITPVVADLDQTFETLEEIHQVITRGIGDEILWAASMPCVLQGDPNIPLADYGSSNLGRLKKTYRTGLGNRYGRSMQTICAVHYNFSFPDVFWGQLAKLENTSNTQAYRSARYFDLIRNFRRFSWLPIYLFGASPAVCNSFVKGRDHELEPFDEGSLHLPFATSLRSGNLGYQSDAQAKSLEVSYNDLASYVRSLATGVTTSYPGYKAMGVKSEAGEYVQLNDCILQSEAEFYSAIRAKRVAPSGSNFLQSLLDDGVEYIEVRLMDLDPFEPLGISPVTVRFLDTFLLYCLLTDSQVQDDIANAEAKTNMNIAVHEGRRPGVKLMNGEQDVNLTDWANEILDEMQPVAKQLDDMHQTLGHSESLALQQTKIDDANNTPSARILSGMQEQSIPFFRFAMNQSLRHRETHLQSELTQTVADKFNQLAAQSMVKHAEIDEASDSDFDRYLADVLAAYPSLARQQ